jgi:hypothetical protein
VQSGVSDDRGEFNFGDVAPGLYFLRLNPSSLKDWAGNRIEGSIALEVNSSAQADRADINLQWSSCGLAYADGNKCERSEVQVERLCGDVSDASGAAISGAEIRLFESGESPKLVHQTQSDGKGEFVFPASLEGTYQLVISEPGFTPFRGVVQVEPKDALTCHQLLKVQLGLFAGCSTAIVR